VKPVFRIVRDPKLCVDCGKCRLACAGNCNVDTQFIGSECVLCMNCLQACPVGSISYGVSEPMPKQTVDRLRGVDVSRRQFFTSLLAGLATVATLRNSKQVMGRGYPLRIRPPGSLAEADFLSRCIRCGECMRACPTNVIQPASTQVNGEAQFTPVLDFDTGYCDVDCVRCTQVCPTGAIRPITTAQKNDEGFGKIGTAFVDRNRCLPWAFGQTCLVCQEVCPVSPKAIVFQLRRFDDGDGKSVRLEMPYVRADACTGCGACQLNCPVQDQPAIVVTSIGEQRSPDRKLML
jgi:MauM/NapG family ferredoxin protein